MSQKTDDDSQLFRDSVHNVRRLPACDKKVIKREKTPGNLQYRRQKAQIQQAALATPVSIKENITAEEIIAYRQPGVLEHQYQRLRNGQFPIAAKLDLHGFTIDSALLALATFFNGARENHHRCILIIHGKGREKAILKNATVAFLQVQKGILAYHSAPASLGGAGATLVLLQKIGSRL